MGVGSGLYMYDVVVKRSIGILKYVCDIVVKKFTFAFSSPDEFLSANPSVPIPEII